MKRRGRVLFIAMIAVGLLAIVGAFFLGRNSANVKRQPVIPTAMPTETPAPTPDRSYVISYEEVALALQQGSFQGYELLKYEE